MMTMNGTAHEKAPRAVLNKHGATLERLKHSVDACIANRQTQDVFHKLSGSEYLQLGLNPRSPVSIPRYPTHTSANKANLLTDIFAH
jgi:hypothetical protein